MGPGRAVNEVAPGPTQMWWSAPKLARTDQRLFTEFTSETLKTPSHIANPVPLIFRYIRVGLTRFNNNPEFNTGLLIVAIHC